MTSQNRWTFRNWFSFKAESFKWLHTHSGYAISPSDTNIKPRTFDDNKNSPAVIPLKTSYFLVKRALLKTCAKKQRFVDICQDSLWNHFCLQNYSVQFKEKRKLSYYLDYTFSISWSWSCSSSSSSSSPSSSPPSFSDGASPSLAISSTWASMSAIRASSSLFRTCCTSSSCFLPQINERLN